MSSPSFLTDENFRFIHVHNDGGIAKGEAHDFSMLRELELLGAMSADSRAVHCGVVWCCVVLCAVRVSQCISKTLSPAWNSRMRPMSEASSCCRFEAVLSGCG